MGFFWELIAIGGPWLLVAQAAFTLWMFIDAYHRRAEQFWMWVILLFQPIGTWLYFLVVKLPSFRLPRGLNSKPMWQRRLSLAELRYRVERTPTVMHRVALAERLMEGGGHREAIEHLEAALAMDETFCQTLHDLAVCHVACRQPDRALEALSRLMQRDSRWADYRAWRTQIEAQDALGHADAALHTCRELEKRQPTWENKCRLAERLIDNGHKDDAIRLLDQALEDHHFAPWKVRLRHWRWARHAQQLLKEAERKM
jgi:hypothetical protein